MIEAPIKGRFAEIPSQAVYSFVRAWNESGWLFQPRDMQGGSPSAREEQSDVRNELPLKGNVVGL